MRWRSPRLTVDVATAAVEFTESELAREMNLARQIMRVPVA